MEYANAKDIKRARDLGLHSGATNLQAFEIARGKASTMAQAITDKKKILGRLEAVASEWDDFRVLKPFIDKCCELWPGSQYTQARALGLKTGIYCKMRIFGGASYGMNGLKINLLNCIKVNLAVMPKLETQIVTGGLVTSEDILQQNN